MDNKLSIDKAEVRRMASLCRLDISEEEEELFTVQFSGILDHMAVLNGVNTDNVEPLYNPVSGSSRQRRDEARDTRTRDEILANAPETDGQYFIVPKIV